MKIIKNYVNGKIDCVSSETLPVYDPSKGEKIAQVVVSNYEDFKSILDSSIKSQQEWSQTTPLKRSRVLSNYKNLIEKNLEELAEIISQEHGKTLDDSIGSITRGLEVVEFSCGIP